MFVTTKRHGRRSLWQQQTKGCLQKSGKQVSPIRFHQEARSADHLKACRAITASPPAFYAVPVGHRAMIKTATHILCDHGENLHAGLRRYQNPALAVELTLQAVQA
jgi:hypothetical protein